MPTPGPGKNKGKAHSRETPAQRRSRSRNTTPMSASSLSAVDTIHSPYLQTSLSANAHHVLSNTPIDDLFEGNGSSSIPPSASTLRTISANVKSQLLNTIKPRGELCERLMRELSSKRKERTERNRQRDMADLAAEERKKALTVTPKNLKRGREEDRPLAVGAHGVARQDGGDAHTGRLQEHVLVNKHEGRKGPKPADKDTDAKIAAATSSSISSPVSQPPRSPASAVGKREGSADSASDPHQPPPAPAIQQYQIFGDDPTAYPDDTVYEIREITPGMSEEEKKTIFSVAKYPESDLHDQIPGTPPDRDFSNAKPAQQINFTTFQNYAETFIRPLTEEDRAFLLERGNREGPFVIPKLGTKHYKEVWAEEDGGMALDPNAHRLAGNEARGSMEDMDDEIAETDQLSVGPALSRLVTAMRGEFTWRGSGKAGDEGDVVLPGIDNMEIDGEAPNGPPEVKSAPSATQFAEQYWKNVAIQRPDYNTVDDRLHRELVYMGLISPTDTPDYASSLDDEVAARLRYLQAELRRVSVKNGARKLRLLELTEDWMSKQEYSTIADDLDNQINQAYLKRNRNIGKKGKQQKRPGGAGGGSHPVGVARTAGAVVGVGEPIKGLVERKTRWKGWIGPVVDNGKTKIPEESVFDPEVMKTYEARDQDAWGEDQDA